MSNELYHWKYIKREKVGDKWKYYYDTASLKSDIKKSIGLGSKERERMLEAKAKLDSATVKRNAMIRRETKAYGESDIGENVRNRTIHYRTQKEYEAKLDQANKQSVKNSLDPKYNSIFNLPKQLEDNAKIKEYDLAAKASKVGVDAYQYRIDKDVDKLSSYRENSAIAIREQIKAAEEYAKAQEEYFNTPMGKLDKAKQSIEKARDYVYELFDDSPEAKAKRTYKRKARKMRR